MIRAIHMAHELGLEEPEHFYDTPGTWITFDFDNHPEMQVGIMTHTVSKSFILGILIGITITEYKRIIETA